MKRTGEIITLNVQATQGAADAFVQASVQTLVSPGGSDGLLMLGAQVEFGSGIGGSANRELVLSRGSKTSMPSIIDDDVIFKYKEVSLLTTSGQVYENMTPFIPLPPQAIIVVESYLFLDLDSNATAAVQTATLLMWFEKVVLTAEEKNAILSARLNNLLS